MAYTEKSARERYESALKRYRTGTKSQIDPNDMRSRYESLMTKYTQAPIPEQTVQSPQVTPVQTQPDPEKRSFGEGAKEFGKAVSGSLGAGILNILRTTLAYAEKAASITLGDGDKSLSENIKDIVSGDRFKDDPDRSTIDKVSPFLSLLGPTSVINVARAMYKSATSETDVNNLIKPTEDKVREWADVENEILPVRIIAGAAGSAPQMLVTMLNPAIGVPILFNSAFQNNLEQYKAEGLDVSDGVVITRAVGSAAIESASEYMFNAWAGLKGASAGLKGAKGVKGAFVSGTKGFLDNFAREAAEKAYAPTVKNFIKFLAKQGLEEGTEELVSGIGAGLMALATTDRGGKFMSWDKEGKTNLKGEAISDEGAIVVMDLIEQFGAGFLMGAVGSTVNTARSFKSTRDVIQNVLGDVNMSSVTEEDVKTVYETLKQDLKSSEAQQELAEKLARGVSKAESVYAEGMQLKNNQTGEVMTVSIAPEGDEITLTSPSGVQKVTHEEFDAMFEQNILTEASPAQTAVNGSDLLPGTPVSGDAVTQQESMTVEGKSRKESVTSYADKKGRPTSIKSYIAGKEAVLEIANPGSQVPAYIRFDPDEYSQAENRAMYLQEVSSRNKTPMSKIASKNAQTVSEFYSAITSAADDAVSTYLSEAQNASLKAEEEKKAVESKKAKEEKEKAQAVASVASAKEEQTVQKETKGKRSDDFSQEMIEKIDKLRKIAREVQKKDVKSGKMDKGVYDALVEIDKSMKEQDIDGYLNIIPDSQVTKRMKKIRDFVKKTTGKKIIFVNSVGDSRVNGVVNDFAKDTVFVNVTGRSDVNITWAIGHELHHLITKDGNGDIMTDAVKDLVGEKAIEDYLAQFKDMPGYQDFLRESGKVTEELVADRAGDVFADPVFWRKIADNMPKSKWQKTANEIAEYLEKAQDNAETEKPGVDAMVKAFEATKKAEKRTKKTDTAESNTASKIEMADEMLNMWKEEGEIPADLQDEAERMSLEVATAASEILDVLDNSTTDFSFRSGIRGAMKGEDQRGSAESGIRTIFAPLLGRKKKWSNVDFVGKTVTSGRELAGVAMVARDPRIEHNHVYYVKNGKLIQHESWTSALPSSASALPFNVRHLKHKTEEQISDVIIHQQEAEISRIKSRAAKLSADSIYMSHNHPSGNPQPSPADAGTCGSLMSKFGEMFKGMVVTDHNEYTFLSRDPSQDPSNPKSLQVGRGKLSKGEQGFSARDKASTKKLIDIRGSFSPEGIVRNLFAGISNFTIKDGDITLVFIDSAARITAVQNVPAGMGKKANAEQFAGYIKNSQAYFGGAMVFAVTFNRPGSTNATFAELTSGVFDYGVLEDVLLYDTGARALKSQREYSNTKPDRSADKMRDLSSTILRDSEKIPNRYHTDFSLKVDTSKINDEAYSKLIVTKAKKAFGTTIDLREAGYILPDGTMLDFSGKRDGGESGVRYMDHRDVQELYNDLQGTEAMQQFFVDTGAIRIAYNNDMVFADITGNGILTEKQISALNKALTRKESVSVDFYNNFTSETPTKSFYYEMPNSYDIATMLDEIERINSGEIVPVIEFGVESQFSLRTEDIERQFKDSKVRNEDGTLKLVYHGTPSEFTVFEGSDRNAKGNASKLGFFFTDNKNVADTYRGSFYFESPDIIREYVDGLSDDDLVRFAKSVKDDWGNVIYEEDADEGYEDTKRRFEFLFTDYEGTGFEHIIDGGKDLNLPGWEKLQDIYDEGSGNMIEAYLNITNPYVIEGLDSFDDSAYTEGIQHALDNGHDGVIITDVDDAYTETPYGMNVTGNVYVVFNSEQVKSPDGTNPVDLRNPDIRYSMQTDSEGRELTGAQVDYFSNSKIRDENGNLLTTYHGTPEGGFTVFDPKHLSMESRTSQQGTGFYFTDNKKWASEYLTKTDIYGKVSKGKNPTMYETYLNIVNPLDITGNKRTLTNEQIMSIITKSDYEFGKGWWKWYILKDKTVSDQKGYDAYLDYIKSRNMSDKTILQDIHKWFKWDNAEGLMTAFKEATGYDGIIESYKGSKIIVATGSEQIKSVDNISPTQDPDIRFSIRGKDPETGIDGMIEAHRFNRAFTEQYLSKDTLELLTDAHKFYRVQPNTETIQLAAKKLETKEGRESARIEASNPNNISAVNTVLRMFFMYEADLRGESAVAADWAHVINKSGKQSGQAIQAYAIFNKLTPGAKIMYAEREILGTVSEDNLKRIRDMGKEVKKVTEEIEGKAKDQISIDDILKSVKQAETDVDRKLKALKRLEDRIKKMMSSTMDYDIDAVKEFIDMIHGVTSVMKPTEEIVNTSNPLTFMRWVLNNMDTMGEIMNQAYDMMKRTHGTDEVFMGEVEAYFSEFIPRFKGKKRPSIQGEITEEIKGIINENYLTFQAMVKRLIEIGVNPADAVLIARETRNQINLLTEQEKIRSLKKLLPKPNSKTTQMIIMKIINTMNDNELSDPHVQAYLAQTMGLPNMSAELQTYIYDLGRQISEINRLAAMDGRPLSKDEQRQTDILMAQILSAVQRAKPVHWTKKVDLFQSMMMMSMFKSAERNIIGNTGFLLVDTGKDIVASGIDKVLSKITGNRTIPLPQLGAMVHGAIEGGKVSYYDIMHDIDTSQLDTQYGLGGQEVFKSKLGRLAMKAFRLKMTFPDRIAQGAVYQSALEGIMKMKGETKASQETIEAAQYEAQYKTFSDDNAASSALSGLRDLLNNFYRSQYWKSGRQDKVQFGLGSFMIKFPKVPGALLMRTIDYSPVALVKSLYLLAKPMYDMRKFGGEFTEHFNQKKFAKNLASGTYGTAVSIGVGYLLTMLGLMTGALPDDEKEKNMLATMGVSRGYQLNMSGLWRFLISGFDIEEAQTREGDTLTTYSWMAPMAIGMAIGANVVQDTIKIKETDAGTAEKALEVSIGAFSAGLDSITEMTVMSGLRDFIDNFKYSPTTLEALIKSTVDVPASFIPQQAKIMRELIDNTARTTYSNDNLEYAYRLILNRLPGASKTLPPSRTVFGNLREVYQGNGNNVWNVFFNPAYVTKYTPNEAAVMVLNVMAEKEGTALEGTNVTPGKMTRYLTYTDSLGMKKKINLTDYEISELQRKVGSRVEELFLKIPASTPMPGKIRMMNKILSEVSHAYKQQLLAQKLANRN